MGASIEQARVHPKNLHLQAQHRILTGVPMPGSVRAAVATDRGTRFRFSAAVMSSFVSPLPQSGQRALKNLNFGERFLFTCESRMTANVPFQQPPSRCFVAIFIVRGLCAGRACCPAPRGAGARTRPARRAERRRAEKQSDGVPQHTCSGHLGSRLGTIRMHVVVRKPHEGCRAVGAGRNNRGAPGNRLGPTASIR